MRLLIVDDHSTNRKLLRVTLEAEGHTTLEATDGVEALALLAHEKVDAVISDILMPNMDGFRLCREIRKSEQLRSLPFIVFTATYTAPADMKLAQTMGADKYLAKPQSTKAVIQALLEVTERKGERPPEAEPPVEETYVLTQYNQALVNKLEDKTAELRREHDRVVQLNNILERRVRERTAELEAANWELTQSLSEVKELRGILPICSYCKKIRDDEDYWQSVEAYIGQRTDAQFSRCCCRDCYHKYIKPHLDEGAT